MTSTSVSPALVAARNSLIGIAGNHSKTPMKALIITESQNPVTAKRIACQFNPASVKFSKQTSWSTSAGNAEQEMGGITSASQHKRNVPQVQFSGGSAPSLSVDLFFDTTDEDNKDVRDYTDALIELTLINRQSLFNLSEPDRPPLVRFVWGEFSANRYMAFLAYVQAADITFSLFLPNGMPVRAEARVTFTAFEDDWKLPFQNPSSRSEQRRAWVVSDGETLDWIAYREYGDPTQWRYIAETNNLENPMELAAGTVLLLKPLPEEM